MSTITGLLSRFEVSTKQETPEPTLTTKLLRSYKHLAIDSEPTNYHTTNALIKLAFVVSTFAPFVIFVGATSVLDALNAIAKMITNGFKRVYSVLNRTSEKEQPMSDRVTKVLKSKEAIAALSLTALALVTYVGYAQIEKQLLRLLIV